MILIDAPRARLLIIGLRYGLRSYFARYASSMRSLMGVNRRGGWTPVDTLTPFRLQINCTRPYSALPSGLASTTTYPSASRSHNSRWCAAGLNFSSIT